MSLLTTVGITLTWNEKKRVFVASSEASFELPTCEGSTRILAVQIFENMLLQMESEGDGVAIVRFGVGNSRRVYFKRGTSVGNLILDTDLAEQMGFDPFAVRVLLDRKPLAPEEKLIPDATIDFETMGTEKSGFAPPKRHKCERWLKNQGCAYEDSAKGDHEVWRVNGERVQLNYRRGELDSASLKAIARALGLRPFDVLGGMRAA